MRLWPSVFFALALLTAYPVAAQQGDWIVTVRAGASAAPPYEGAPNSEIHPTLSFGAHHADKPYRFSPPDDGGSLDLISSRYFDIGPALTIRRGRDDTGRLTGFQKIGWAAEPGVFVNLWASKWLRARVQVRQGIFGHHGAVGDAGIDYIHTGHKWDFSIGPRIGFGDARYMETYFGVTPAEALASPFLTKPYAPGAGVRYGGVGVACAYHFTNRIRTTVGVGYHRLVGVAADSPVVAIAGSRDQFSAGIGVSYSFGVHLGQRH